MRLSELLLLLLLYTSVTNACSSRKFRMERSAFAERPFQPKDAEEILSLRRGQDRYNPDEIDCSTRTRIVRDVGVLLRATIARARARASLVLSQPYIFCYIFSTKPSISSYRTAHQTANTFDCNQVSCHYHLICSF